MKNYHGNVKCKCGVSLSQHKNLEFCKKFIPNEEYVKKKSLVLLDKIQLKLF